jgi:hypothetical protein
MLIPFDRKLRLNLLDIALKMMLEEAGVPW